MKPVVQLTEYGITGGVMLTNLFIFATLLALQSTGKDITLPHAFQIWQEWATRIAAFTAPLGDNKTLEPAVTTIVTTLGVVLIFCTGLLLDLTAPLFFALFEIVAFKRWLICSMQRWFTDLIHEHGDLVADDYTRFQNEPPQTWLVPQRWLAQRARYVRLHSFVSSYLLFRVNDAGLEQLQEQTRLWRTSRAISTSMIFLGALLTFFGQGSDTAESLLISMGVPVVLFTVSTLITMTIFARLCTTMCSLTYLSRHAAARGTA